MYTTAMAAFMGGRLQAEGDVMLGTRLSQLFEGVKTIV